MQGFTDKVVVITGGGSGIGLALAFGSNGSMRRRCRSQPDGPTGASSERAAR